MPITEPARPRRPADAPTPLERVRSAAGCLRFEPLGTVRCQGAPAFRTRAARDAACLLDLDSAVTAWSCLAVSLERDGETHVPDLLVERAGVAMLLDAVGEGADAPAPWVTAAAADAGFRYEVVAAADLPAVRLENCVDLLRYARWRVPLGERVRLLALLEDGPLPLGACLAALRSPDPMGVVAALALRRFVELDLDDGPIGPSTRVRAIAAAL